MNRLSRSDFGKTTVNVYWRCDHSPLLVLPECPLQADSAATQPSLKDMFAAKRSAEWSCTTCMSSNSLDKDKCVACGGAKPSASTAKLSTSSSLFGSATNTATVASSSKVRTRDLALTSKMLVNWIDLVFTSKNASKLDRIERRTLTKFYFLR